MIDNSHEWEVFMTDVDHVRKFFIKVTKHRIVMDNTSYI